MTEPIEAVLAAVEMRPPLVSWTMHSGCTDYACGCHETLTVLASRVRAVVDELKLLDDGAYQGMPLWRLRDLLNGGEP